MESDHNKIMVVGSFGVGGSRIVTGRAAIVTGHKHLGKVCKGDIIVAPAIYDTWNFGSNLPAGIVTEKGDRNSYAVSLGKTLGIPVIVGAKGATKKINDGSLIALDYSRKAVYSAEKNDSPQVENVIVIPLENHHHHYHEYDYDDLTQSNDNHDFLHHEHHTIDISLEQLQSDTLLIKKYVIEDIANDIKSAKYAGRWLAWYFNRISYYAYDAIPFNFFNDDKAIEEAFKRFEEGVTYIQDVKELFKKDKLGNKTKIDESKLAEFLYRQVVEKINVTDHYRDILRKEPIKMDEYVQKGIVKKDEYMLFTLLNFVVRYYLEQELKNK